MIHEDEPRARASEAPDERAVAAEDGAPARVIASNKKPTLGSFSFFRRGLKA